MVSAGDALVVTFAALGAAVDLRTRRIPNRLTVSGMAIGVTLGFVTGGAASAGVAVLGALIGFALLCAPFALGLVGAGDVKFLMALGTFLGPPGTFEAFLWATAAGGLLAAIMLGVTSRGRNRVLTSWIQFKNFLYTRDVSVLKPTPRSDTIAVPYGLVLAFGGLVAHFCRGILVG